MARPVKSLALSPAEAAPSPRRPSAQAPAETRLWLAVRLPELVLQSLSGAAEPFADRTADRSTARPAGRSPARPVAVVESRGGRPFIVAAGETARSLGVEPGLGLSAAFAFSGSLEVLERSLGAERAHLQALAVCCGGLSPMVSIESPDALLLEVGASLRLFGGLASIKTRLARTIAGKGFTAELAAAPTPLGALWLVRGQSRDALSLAQLHSRSSPLALAVTRWPQSVQTLLADMGARTIGDCLRLPRDGFARRVGPDYLRQLDQALGKLPDPRGVFAPPERLSFKVELPEQTADLAMLAAALERMTQTLAAELGRRQADVCSLRLVLEHWHRAPTVLSCELVEGAHDAPRFRELLCDKLERRPLPTPVTAVGLETGPLEPIRLPAVSDLFETRRGAPSHESSLRLVERLRGRLGPKAVRGLATVADHRPEKAWAKVPEPRFAARAAEPSAYAHERPLWLLPVPRELGPAGAEPCFHGPLRIHAGPERIASGWWDGEGVDKDYFKASNAEGQSLWIYLDRRRRAWYLHGIFG